MERKVFGSKYEVFQNADSKGGELGKGGQGSTFQVRNRQDNKIYALKSIGNKENKLARLKKEYENLLILNEDKKKPHSIPCIYDSNFEGNEYYIVMEYIKGTTIDKLLNERDFETVLQGIFTLISSVKYCHEKGIIHRDIKPQNIIAINNNLSDLALIDYGISYDDQSSNELTFVAENVGNKFCPLPESRIGNYKRKKQTDIIGCVAVLFYLLTGISPNVLDTVSDGIKPHDRIEAIIKLQWVGNQKLRLLNEIFNIGFEPQISNRFQTCEELLFALNRLNKMEYTRIRPYGKPCSFCLETFLREFKMNWEEKLERFVTNYKYNNPSEVFRKIVKYDVQNYKIPLGSVDIEKRENYLIVKNKVLWLDAILSERRNLYYDDLDILFLQKMSIEQLDNLDYSHWGLYANFEIVNNIIHFTNLEIRKNGDILNVYKPFVKNVNVPICEKIIHIEFDEGCFIALSDNGILFKFGKDASIKDQVRIIDFEKNIYDTDYIELAQTGIIKIKKGYTVKCFKEEVMFLDSEYGKILEDKNYMNKTRTDKGNKYIAGCYKIICNKMIMAPKPDCIFIGYANTEDYLMTHFIDYEKVINSVILSDEENIFLLFNSDGSASIINVVNGSMFSY